MKNERKKIPTHTDHQHSIECGVCISGGRGRAEKSSFAGVK